MLIYGIDPGTRESAIICLRIDDGGFSVDLYETLDNRELFWLMNRWFFLPDTIIAIEKIVAHKWAGKETSDAAIWSGIFAAVHFTYTKFITRARVRWEITKNKCGGDKEINSILKNPDPRFPGLCESIRKNKVRSHGLAAVAVALAAHLNPSCSERGTV